MSGRRGPSEVGATAAPELDVADLEVLAVDALEPRFELERVRLDGAELAGAEAGCS